MLQPEHFASASLAALAGLHLLWATGSPWPLADRATFSDAVVGQAAFPLPAACVNVATGLAAGSALVSGWPHRFPRIRRAGVLGVVGILSLHGALGIVGRTDAVSPGSSSPRFLALDRKFYSPISLMIAALAAPAARPSRTQRETEAFAVSA